jgi:hypothetical protein
MVEEGVEQLAHRPFRGAPQVLGDLRRELRSCPVSRSASIRGRSCWAVCSGRSEDPDLWRGNLPNVWQLVAYPCHWPAVRDWDGLRDGGLAERQKPSSEGWQSGRMRRS